MKLGCQVAPDWVGRRLGPGTRDVNKLEGWVVGSTRAVASPNIASFAGVL